MSGGKSVAEMEWDKMKDTHKKRGVKIVYTTKSGSKSTTFRVPGYPLPQDLNKDTLISFEAMTRQQRRAALAALDKL